MLLLPFSMLYNHRKHGETSVKGVTLQVGVWGRNNIPSSVKNMQVLIFTVIEDCLSMSESHKNFFVFSQMQKN